MWEHICHENKNEIIPVLENIFLIYKSLEITLKIMRRIIIILNHLKNIEIVL